MAAAADLAKLKVTNFSAALGSCFEIKLPETKGARAATKVVPLTLVKAQQNGVALPKEKAKPEDKVRAGNGFWLEFVAPQVHGLPQRIYTVNLPKLGITDLF